MTGTGHDESGQVGGEMAWFRRRHNRLLVASAAVVAFAALWLGLALNRTSADSGDRLSVAPAADDRPILKQARRYSDEELGLDELIEREVVPFDAQYRSFSDWEEPHLERRRYFEQIATGHERERIYFENNLALVFWQAYENLPVEFGLDGTLERAYDLAMGECADASGWPGLRLNVSSKSDVDHALEISGLSYESFLDLRHECAKQAAAYPTLDPAARDELLEGLKEHYLVAAYEYLQEFPDAEVPLVEHEGSPRPLEERLIAICQKTPDPTTCAAEYRVELPTE